MRKVNGYIDSWEALADEEDGRGLSFDRFDFEGTVALEASVEQGHT